ncbi:hypothetical protein [Anabaena sp. CCY 0017]|uniref:hypothetical protein n=1 Tax=Anabaena sp. CCY 0017 TaxID=3103866 RepID=UPI0039C759B6
MGEGSNLKSWLNNHHITEREFGDRLSTSSENNFMYLTQIMSAIAQALTCQFADNLDLEPFEYNQLPPALAAYYQQHLQKMLPPAQQQEFSRDILNILATEQQPISAEAIADILDIDEFTVEEILENWLEFLQRRTTGDQTQYQLYHSSFRDWIIQIWS